VKALQLGFQLPIIHRTLGFSANAWVFSEIKKLLFLLSGTFDLFQVSVRRIVD
jgi:hypothetical protein